MHIETIAAWAQIIEAAIAALGMLWKITRWPRRAASAHAG